MKGILFSLFGILLMISCSKSGGNDPTPQEQTITFTIDATDNSVSTSNSYGFIVTLTSTMPASGIKIDVTTTDQVTNNIVQNQTYNGYSRVTAMAATSLFQQHWNLVNVKVSSASTPTNSANKSFTVVYK